MMFIGFKRLCGGCCNNLSARFTNAQGNNCRSNKNNLLSPQPSNSLSPSWKLSTSKSTKFYSQSKLSSSLASNSWWILFSTRPRLQQITFIRKPANNNYVINSESIPSALVAICKQKIISNLLFPKPSALNLFLDQRREFNYCSNNRKMAKIISGKEVSDEIRAKLKVQVESMKIKPKLAIVQVGGREDSNVYIRMKIQFAESIGASAELMKLSRDITEQDLANKVRELNNDSSVHGIITQLPFDCSQKIDSDKIVNLIDPSKDVDGLCVYNAGKLLHGELDNSNSFIPCTPNGCLELIKKSGINLVGTHSVVIGRSKIVGSPMAQLLLWNNSTVTICHSKTKNLDEICRQADVVVAAVGRAQMVKKSWLKPGAVVIDCGINVIPDATKKSGTRLVGDVDFDDCKEVASAITPVPGGVGPMTVAMLISNTVLSASRVQK